jgi:3-phenylpropionate/trans-cinnamate dioxygenase ferredoxin reductase subunit
VGWSNRGAQRMLAGTQADPVTDSARRQGGVVMADERRVVVVGGGLAGARTVEALRKQGFDGPVTLVGDETELPYERPPLSKGYLAGTAERASVFVHPADWYQEQQIELLLGTPVRGLDRGARRLTLADDSTVPYDRLVLATGSTPRQLPLPGADAAGVLSLRRLADSDRLREAIAGSAGIVVIGAGWIGLEAAAAARATGVPVTVLEAAELPLLRVLGAEVAQVFADLHREHGVDLRLSVQVQELRTEAGAVTGVQLADGSTIAADTVLVGVGIVPNVGLAESSGLVVDNGVVVDEHLRTEDETVYAVGDVANAWHPVLGRRIRVEHWANARFQPLVAVTNLLGGDAVYDRQPYFYTDQYDLGMEYTGYVEPGEYDDVVFRGDRDGRQFIAFWLRQGRVLAGMNVNVWDVTKSVKALIARTEPVDQQRLADPDLPLDDV